MTLRRGSVLALAVLVAACNRHDTPAPAPPPAAPDVRAMEAVVAPAPPSPAVPVPAPDAAAAPAPDAAAAAASAADAGVPATAEGAIALARIAVEALRTRDLAALALQVDPGHPVRVIDLATGARPRVPVTRETLPHLLESRARHTFTTAYGGSSGTVADYFTQYVYDADYARATPGLHDDVNGEAIGSTRDVTRREFPHGFIVAFRRGRGTDRTRLYLVYEPIDGALRLTGIAHDAWTP